MKTKIIVQLFVICSFCSTVFSQITFVASATAYSASTTLTINKPAGTAQNDVMLAHIAVEDDNGTADVTPPAGWTLIRTLNNYSYIITYTYYKVAGAAEPGSYAFTRSTATYDMFGAISTYNGVDTSTPIEAENGQNTAASSSHSTPSVNTTTTNDMIVCFFAVDYNNGCQTWTPPAGMTERYDGCGSATYQSISSADVIQASAGATGAKTATSSASGTKGTAQIVALNSGVTVPMSYTSCTTTQGNTSGVYKSIINNEVIGIEIVTAGSTSPLSVTSFTCNTTGCTNASIDITNAKIFYTGTNSSFSTVGQFGSTVASPNGTFTFTGSRTLASGTNYFWLCYDVPAGATTGNVIDAQCTALTVTSNRTPTSTNPAGSRQIINAAAAQSVAAGGSHSCALCNDGKVWAWGLNSKGQLGDGTTNNSLTPIQLSSLAGIIAITAGTEHSVALKSDGTVWAWGANPFGNLGDGTTTDRYSPVQVSGLTGITAIVAGAYHNLALKNDGTVWAWGSSVSGEIGDGATVQRLSPVQVSGLTGMIAIEAGWYNSIAVKSDGTVWTWGENGNGAIGDGTIINRYTPVQVSGLTGMTGAIDIGIHQVLAVKSDGTVWAWGRNYEGQVGDGTTTNKLTPVQVSGLTGMTDVAAGNYYSLALKSDGTVWAWGYNGWGNFGNGTTTDSYTPVQASSLTGISSLSTRDQTLAVKSSGTAKACGYNANGQLGDGTTSNTSSAITINVVCGFSSLPIELLHFDAYPLRKEEKVKLTWATATETNNDFFTLQRSRDALNWENMKEVNGAGNSTNIINYVDYDPSPYLGTSYYRLKQTDFNGQYSYSDIRAVNFEGIEIVSAYPVPSGNYLNLMINTYADTDASLELYNAMGQLVLKENKQLILGMNNISISTETFSEGNYLIKVQTADLLYSDKITFIIR